MKYAVLLAVLLSACTAARKGAPVASVGDAPSLSLVPPGDTHLVIGDIEEDFVKAGVAFFKGARGPVALTFRSFGGSVYDGLELLRAMEEFPHPIVCRVDVAMSMGAVLTSACTTRIGLPRTVIMMHGAAGGARGKGDDLGSAADHLRVISLALGRQFCQRLKIPEADCMAKFAGAKEWFLDANEALAVGALDFIAK
jgi:ATP-dependent protease ClpP protease subunit